MNRKQLLILLAAVIVLGGAGLEIYRTQNASWTGGGAGAGQKLLPGLPVNDVAAIVIRSGTNVLDLIKKQDRWRVAQRSDYPADYAAVRDFLVKAADLKATQIEEIGPSQLGRFKLLPPGQGTNTGVLVEMRDAGGKTIQSLLLGKEHQHKAARNPPMGEGEEGWPDGRYVIAGTHAGTVAVISDPLGNIDAKADLWLNKDFFKVEKLHSIAVDFPNPTNSWKVVRDSESSEWKLAVAGPGEQLDSAKTSSFAYALNSPTFADVLPMDTKVRTGLDKPTVIALETFDDFAYTLKIGEKTNDNCFLTVKVTASLPGERTPGKDEKADDKERLDKEFKAKQKTLEDKLAQEKGLEPWVYLVSNWTLDSLLEERSQLLAQKKEAPSAEPKQDAN